MRILLNRLFPPLLLQVVFLLTWHFIAVSGVFPPTFLTPPLSIVEAIRDLAGTGELWEHIGWSVARVIEGFLIGNTLGFLTGVAIGLSKTLEDWLGPTLDTLKQVPVFAWGPLLIVVFGIDEASKIAFIAVACFYPVLLSTFQGVRGIQRKYLEVAKILELSRFKILVRILVPSSLPFILTGIRQALALAWMAVVGAELMGAESGIGYLMMQARMLFQIDIVLAGVFLIGLIGITINSLLEALEKKLIYWRIEV